MSKGSSDVIRPETVLRGHKDSVNCVGFLTDEVLASGSVDGVLKLWSISSRRAILSIQAHKESVLSVDATLSSIITCGRDGFAKLWQIDHESIVSSDSPALSFQTGAKHFCNASCDRGHNSDHNLLLTPSSDESEILIWDLRDNSNPIGSIKQKNIDRVGTGAIAERGMVFSLLLRSHCGTEERNEVIPELGSEDNPQMMKVPKVLLSSSVPRLLAGYEDGSICYYDIRTFRAVCDIRPHQEPVMAMDLSPSGDHVVSAGGGDLIARSQLRDYSNQQTVSPSVSISAPYARQPSATSSWVGSNVAAEPSSDDSTTGNLSSSLVAKDSTVLPSKGTSCIRYRTDGRIMASGHWDNSIRIFDTKRLKPLAVLRHHRDKVYALDFAPSSTDPSSSGRRPGLFASGSKDSTIALWNVFEETYRR